MTCKEKARQKGEPIPNAVCQDNPEIKLQPLDLQALRHPTHPNIQDIQAQRISRLYAVSFVLALTISELAFSGCPR